MICGIHYFITTLKTKIDVIILSRFKHKIMSNFHPLEVVDRVSETQFQVSEI